MSNRRLVQRIEKLAAELPEVAASVKAFVVWDLARKTNIQPRNDRIIVKRHPAPESTVYLSDRPKSQRGTILAVGPGRWNEEEGWREPMTVQPGDEVLFSSKWNDLARDRFDDLPLGADPTIHLLQEADVLAILS